MREQMRTLLAWEDIQDEADEPDRDATSPDRRDCRWDQPNTLIRNWSPAFTEWSTKAIRDAFLAPPLFPRLLNAEVIKETIVRGFANGLLAYAGEAGDGSYQPFHYKTAPSAVDVEISDDMFVNTRETAEGYVEKQRTPELVVNGGGGRKRPITQAEIPG